MLCCFLGQREAKEETDGMELNRIGTRTYVETKAYSNWDEPEILREIQAAACHLRSDRPGKELA